ncbi:Uncharacterised protein [Mycobacterium tuberculosis]|uniref:Uncharacterized protein n=1 Tax=Mycobacterium tuberculosis TaxID=1773 RepID=A0A0T9FZT4_MYCTX|nr:Uncharacterised protein [Mycobacterium tuberculosis]CFE53522.1 Uncharacterised protein [Mycobacterium tuberculosis]CFR91348.1 Uncharacterised protein [Mycobacterium tuberculosis]CFS16621.1 Uncharacterised protein [Mycobacterium tuberculosis]CKO48156.1 Uncharacterised protein [Mycobacterium tuberculosis]
MLVVGDIANDQLPGAGVGPQPLLPAPRVTGNHRVGRRQDVLRRAVILFQQNGSGVGVVTFEVFDVADGGAAERIDRLIGIPDDAQLAGGNTVIAVAADQLAHQYVLGVVGVLVFVNQDMPEPPTVVLGDLREGLQHRDGLADQVVEVQRVGRPQPPLVFVINRRHGAR